MRWWKRTKPKVPNQREISVGDCIINKPEYINLDIYFINGPRKVTSITDGPEYAGGSFVHVEYAGEEHGFYLNAVKKVPCC